MASRSSPEGSVCPSTRSAGGVIPGFGNDNAAVRVPHQDGRTIFERDGAFHSQGERGWPALCMLSRLAKLICQLGGAAHRHTVTTCRGACRAPRAIASRSQYPVGARAPTALGFAVA